MHVEHNRVLFKKKEKKNVTCGCACTSQITERDRSVPHLHSSGIPNSAGREQECLSSGAELIPLPSILWKHEEEEISVKLDRLTS